MLTTALLAVALGGIAAAYVGGLGAQMLLSLLVGLAGAVGQPSFDAMTQRYVPRASQGRAFARFSTRQQLVWVIGALIPVALVLSFKTGDIVIAVVAVGGATFYAIGRFNRVRPKRRGRQN